MTSVMTKSCNDKIHFSLLETTILSELWQYGKANEQTLFVMQSGIIPKGCVVPSLKQ